MARVAQLEPEDLAWARQRFRAYYADAPVVAPRRFARREFAAFPFASATLMRRHASFATAAELRRFLRDEAPRHVYYSSAYYRFPAHPNMREKVWLGADLVFDLDADHLRQPAGLGYAEQLALAKQRFRRLLDDFLFGDFGLDPRETTLVFSGGRGYHAHVHESDFVALTSAERRELVEYVLGVGVDPREALGAGGPAEEETRPSRASDTPRSSPPSGGPAPASRSRRPRGYGRIPSPDAPGWPGRLSRALGQTLERWEREGTEVAVREMVESGLTPARARRLAQQLVEEGRGRRVRERLSLEVFKENLPPGLWDSIFRYAAIEVQGETDAPVTTDIHRLIRLPGSLHGGTGLRVVPLALDELDDFDPLRDALVAPAPDGAAERVRLTEAVDYRFGAEGVRGAAGESVEVPRAIAVFLVLRGEATRGAGERAARPAPEEPPPAPEP